MATLTLTVNTANIRGLPEQRYIFVRNRIRRAITQGGIEGITCLQECSPNNITKSRFKRNRKRYAVIVAAEAKRAGKVVFGGGTEIPIVLSTKIWDVDGHEVFDVHGGMAHVSPDRDINRVLATHRRANVPVEVDNGHPVSKGHYPAWKRGIKALGWRIARLSDYMAAEAAFAERSHKAGRLHVFAGDLNDPTPERIHAHQVGLNNQGLDHIVAVPAPGHRITGVVRGSVRKTKQMDHPILSARFTQKAA
jgi:hypothetical protein